MTAGGSSSTWRETITCGLAGECEAVDQEHVGHQGSLGHRTKAATRLPCDPGNFLQLIYKMGQ